MRMQTCLFRKDTAGSRLFLGGFAPIKKTVIDAITGYWQKEGDTIAPIAYGTNWRIRFFRHLKRSCARMHLGNGSTQFIRSDFSGNWKSHPEYIQETIDREKMRFYELN